MVKYLENNICDFEILFDIDYNKKVNILSTCFFKMNSHYKKFTIYVEGLKRLITMLDTQSDYTLRIFIDEHIRKDKEIMQVLQSSKKVEIVVFKCSDYIRDNYHIDVFGALVRLFPVFDFNNNDAKNVIVIDIDLNKNDLLVLKEFMGYKTDKVQIVGKGLAQKLFIQKIVPHFFCGLIGFYNKKYYHEIITDFIINAKNIKDKGIYGKREKPFGYGTDELFLNDYFIYSKKYNIDADLGLVYDYDINWFVFYYKEDLLNENTKNTHEYLKKILDMDDTNLSTEELFNLLDKKIYHIFPFDKEKIKITKRYYDLIENLVKNKKEWFDFDNMLVVDKFYHGVIESISIVFFDKKTLKIQKVSNINSKNIKN
jgi:hypothetical protein